MKPYIDIVDSIEGSSMKKFDGAEEEAEACKSCRDFMVKPAWFTFAMKSKNTPVVQRKDGGLRNQ